MGDQFLIDRPMPQAGKELIDRPKAVGCVPASLLENVDSKTFRHEEAGIGRFSQERGAESDRRS